jgi:hypothetical protein
MPSNDIVIKPNPLSSGTPVASDLASITGMDQGTVAAKLDSEIRSEQDKRMMDPAAYSNVNDPYDVVKTAAETVKVELMHPELDITDDKDATTEQAEGANEFSVDEMNNWDTAAEWANSLYPDDDDISGESIASNELITAGSVNGDKDMTNQSLDFINSIEPTAETQGPEIDVVPDEGGGAMDNTGDSNNDEEDPSLIAGDEI